MPNSTCVHEHHFGAIEAAIRETARGRAFLADYARKVRQSDTLTMLATIARLERWCADQAARLAELERRDHAVEDRPRGDQAGFLPALSYEPAVPVIGRGEENPVFVEEIVGEAGEETASPDQSYEVRGRIEHLASAFCDFDRRAAVVARHRRPAGSFTSTDSSANGTSFASAAGALIPHAAASAASGFARDGGGGRQLALEEDVLDGIAKALGTQKTADRW